jgi:beta-fructofuranosidase
MFYTGTSRNENGRVQRIGLATSDDLITWRKCGDQALIEADRRWYETAGTSDWPEEAWRDPWVFEADGIFHALTTARVNHGRSDERGVVGHATSDDLVNWEVRPPLSEPGEFAHLEVPQLVELGGDYVLVFSCDQARVSNRRRTRLGETPDSVYVVPSSKPLGPYNIKEATGALPTGLYSGRLIRRRDNTWVWLAFLDETGDRDFVGELSDPIPYPWLPLERR